MVEIWAYRAFSVEINGLKPSQVAFIFDAVQKAAKDLTEDDMRQLPVESDEPWFYYISPVEIKELLQTFENFCGRKELVGTMNVNPVIDIAE